MDKEKNRQLFNRLTVYIIVFVLVTVSYINFTNNKDNNLDTVSNEVATLDTTKAVEAPEEDIENMDEEMVLGEVDIEDIEVVEEEVTE